VATKKLAGGFAAAVLALSSAPALAAGSGNACYPLGTADGYFRLAVSNPVSLLTGAEIANGAPKTTTYDASGFFNSILGSQFADGSVLVTRNTGAAIGLTGHSTTVFGILDV
jgi:hypothetical protein